MDLALTWHAYILCYVIHPFPFSILEVLFFLAARPAYSTGGYFPPPPPPPPTTTTTTSSSSLLDRKCLYYFIIGSISNFVWDFYCMLTLLLKLQNGCMVPDRQAGRQAGRQESRPQHYYTFSPLDLSVCLSWHKFICKSLLNSWQELV